MRAVGILFAVIVMLGSLTPLGTGAQSPFNCEDFASQAEAQQLYDFDPERHASLAPDGSGIACAEHFGLTDEASEAATDDAGTGSITTPPPVEHVDDTTATTVNVQLILDVSGSMAQVLPTGETRMDAAKQVMRNVITSLPERDGVNVGLRIYGHEGDNTEAGRSLSCASSELVVAMDGVDQAALWAEVEQLQPTGWTPLALSLERAGEDFAPAGEGIVNAVVLVTDGLETCDGDPVAAAGALRASDIELVTHVVGFALTAEEQAILSGIAEQGDGLLLGAGDQAELNDALFTVLEALEVVQGTGFIAGNALSLLEEGAPGEIAVVASGPYDGNVLPLVVRNNSGDDVIRVSAVASARNPAGQLVASGGDQGFSPNLVRAGGVAIGYVYLDGIDLPPETSFEFDITATPASDDRFENRRDLNVVEATPLENRVVGMLQNGYDGPITGPIGVDVVCFDEAGSLLKHQRDYAAQDTVEPGATVPFQVTRFDGGPCHLFLVAGNGFDNTFGSSLAGVGPTPADDVATVAIPDDGDRDAACADLASAEGVLRALQLLGVPIGDYEVFTAESDPNELLGRPGQYTSKVNFRDSRLATEMPTYEVSDGGSVEVFETADRAEARQVYIQALGEAAPMFAEYNFQQGPILVRVSSRLTPDQVTVYELALHELENCP